MKMCEYVFHAWIAHIKKGYCQKLQQSRRLLCIAIKNDENNNNKCWTIEMEITDGVTAYLDDNHPKWWRIRNTLDINRMRDATQ